MDPTRNTGTTASGAEGSSAYEPSAYGASGERFAAAGNGAEHAPGEAFKQAAKNFAELKEYFAYYVAAKKDGIAASVRNLGLYAVLGVLGLIAGGAIVVTAAVLLLTGLAGAIGAI